MRFKYMNIKVLFLILTAFSLSACNHNQETQGKTQEGHKVTTTEISSAAQTSAYEGAAKISRLQNSVVNFPGKPHAPVSMTYEFVQTAELNEELEIKLSVRVETSTEMLKVNYTTQDSIKSMDASQQYEFSQLQKGATQVVTIRVIPEQSGLHYVNVFATIVVDGGLQSRSFAIPVSTGSVSTEQMKSIQLSSPKGMRYIPEQNIISMPSSEPTQ
ncbi:MAG: hypothetical protein OQK46_06050 [Gammaproteobacteria bacterium]|nr:hypothetical protein [Gammaproteobacteria bacterium]